MVDADVEIKIISTKSSIILLQPKALGETYSGSPFLDIFEIVFSHLSNRSRYSACIQLSYHLACALLSRSFWQPHKIAKAKIIILFAAVAATKKPSRCIAVA